MRRLTCVLLLVLASNGWAQNCPRGMLQITGPASYVSTASLSALQLTHGFTIECWAQADAASHGGGLVDKGLGAFSPYGIFVDTGGRFFGAVRKSAPIKISSAPIDSFNHWHHLAYVFRPGDSVYLYIDSFEVASSSVKNISAIDSSNDSLRIGLSAMGVSFLGAIDELRLWNTPRTEAQIRSNLYGVVPVSPQLVLYYSFDDGIGYRRVHDFSGRARDGYLQGVNVSIVQSTSPVLDASPGWQLATKEPRIIIPTLRCRGAFDTVIHIHNLGPRPESIRKYAFYKGTAFSIISSFPIPLPADSSYYAPIVLHFEPSIGGTFEDTLSIIDSSECGGTLQIGVRAVYDSVGLAFSPSVLDFDSVLNCDLPKVATVTVTNVSVTDSITLVAPSLPQGLMLLNKFPRKLAKSESMIDSFVLLPGTRGPTSMQAGVLLDKCSRLAVLNVKALRQQPEWSLPNAVDFGNIASDLAGISRDTMIVATNTGNVTTAIQAVTTTDTILTILDQRKSVLRSPGDTVQIRIRIKPQGCGYVTARLHVNGRMCATDTASVVSMNVVAPQPLKIRSFDVGRICPSQSVKRIVTVSNPNDQPVRLDTTVFSKNNIFFTPPFYPNLIAPHDSISLEFLFQPALDGDYVDTAFLQMSPCGTAVAVLRGSRGYSGLTFGTSVLSFGRGCDTTSVTRTIALTNSGARSITIIDTQRFGSSHFHVLPVQLPLTLNPGEVRPFKVVYTPNINVADTGSLILIASEGCPAVRLSIVGSREFAHAKVSPPVLDFDTTCPGFSTVRTIGIQNVGLDSIDIRSAIVSGHGFTLDSAPLSIGDSGKIIIRYTAYSIGSDTGTLLLTLDDCGTTVLLPLRGTTGPGASLALSDTSIDFGDVKAGDSSVRCLTLHNIGCNALSISIESLGVSVFSSTALPKSLAAGDSVQLCITFKPITYGNVLQSVRITSNSAPARTITLRGTGRAPDVRVAERMLDFGYVLRGTSKSLRVHIANIGNDVVSITTAQKYNEYGVASPVILEASASDSITVTFYPNPSTGLLLDTLSILWNGHYDTVYLRGQGTEKGMIPSATALNFGDVHVTDSRTLPLYITATQDFPTITSVMMLAGSSGAFTDSAIVPRPIQGDQDTFTIGVKYNPLREQRDIGYLLVSDGTTVDTVLLAGRGVEAHVQVNAVEVDYGPDTIGVPLALQPLRITNTGTYRMFVNALQIGPDFGATLDPSDPILPDSSRAYTITFLPTRARRVVDSLYITTTSPDKIAPIAFAGTGVYPAGTGPSFGYSVASTQTQPGERDTIPVSMFGTRLSKIDADSLILELTFDPSMVLMHGIVSATPSRMIRTSDSTIECDIRTNTFDSGSLFALDAEALLGPNPTSYIHIRKAEPAADVAESVTDGLYQVIDCGGSEHGVVFGNGYKVQSISPNPANDRLSLSYQLGFDGPVAIDLCDALGRNSKHIERQRERAGAHTELLDVSTLPEGRYVYRIESLDFKSCGSVLLVR